MTIIPQINTNPALNALFRLQTATIEIKYNTKQSKYIINTNNTSNQSV